MANPSSRLLAFRILFSLLVASAVTGISLWSAIHAVGTGYAEHKRIRFSLHRIQGLARQFAEEKDKPAASLEELASTYDGQLLDWYRLDPWEREYLYEIVHDEVRISTLGRDGKEGGLGLDADVATDNLHPESARLPLWQFLFDVNSEGVLLVSLLSGLLAGGLTFRELRTRHSQGEFWLMWVFWMAVWVWMSVMGVGVIGALHLVPNGH